MYLFIDVVGLFAYLFVDCEDFCGCAGIKYIGSKSLKPLYIFMYDIYIYIYNIHLQVCLSVCMCVCASHIIAPLLLD